MATLILKKTSQWWYGRYYIDRQEYSTNLGIKIRGKRPATLRETGSVQFERSRTEAQLRLDQLLADTQSEKTAEELAQAVYKARTGGRSVQTYTLNDLPDIWRNLPRRRQPSDRYSAQ